MSNSVFMVYPLDGCKVEVRSDMTCNCVCIYLSFTRSKWQWIEAYDFRRAVTVTHPDQFEGSALIYLERLRKPRETGQGSWSGTI
jgi:hypothetical protein